VIPVVFVATFVLVAGVMVLVQQPRLQRLLFGVFGARPIGWVLTVLIAVFLLALGR